jgi:hypothetical protein
LELNLVKNSIQKGGISLSEVKLDLICDVFNALSAMKGPGDSLKGPHSHIDNDSDDDKSSFPSKFDKNNKTAIQKAGTPLNTLVLCLDQTIR